MDNKGSHGSMMERHDVVLAKQDFNFFCIITDKTDKICKVVLVFHLQVFQHLDTHNTNQPDWWAVESHQYEEDRHMVIG